MFDGTVGSTETQLKTLVTNDISTLDGLKVGNTGDERIIMTGSRSVNISPGTNTPITDFAISRLASKIILDITGTNDITITGYSIKNLPKRSFLIAHPNSNESADTDIAIGTDAVTTSGDWFNTSFTTVENVSKLDVTFYMYENRRGGRKEISTSTGVLADQTQKAYYAPDNSTYVEIYAKGAGFSAIYKIYLGADNSQNYNIKRNGSYTYTISLKSATVSDTRVNHTGFSVETSSSGGSGSSNFFGSGVSNCYIVAPGKSVYIPVIRANQSSKLGTQISDITSTEWTASLYWQTTQNLVTVSTSAESRSSGCFKVEAPSTTATGNAVIVVKNTTGTILWSWHVWVTGYNPDATYEAINGNTWMDRNLGALAKATGTTDNTFDKCGGLLYQWGRKDPFPGSNGSSTGSATTLPIWNFTPSYSSSGLTTTQVDTYIYSADASASPISYANQLSYSVKYPLLFLINWAGSTATVASDYTSIGGMSSWGGESGELKTVYDPCPAGWRVPSGRKASSTFASPWSSWTTAYTTYSASTYATSTWNNGTTGYYPITGYRGYTDGYFRQVGEVGSYWSASVLSSFSYHLDVLNGSVMPSHTDGYRAYAMAIRCVKE